MKKNSLIIVPFKLPWNWSADYQRQTCLKLAKDHKVIAYLHYQAHFFLKPATNETLPKIKKLTFIKPKYYFPFKRIETINQLNQHLSLNGLISSNKNQPDNTYLWVFNPDFYHWTTIKTAKIIYDCVDFHAGAFKDKKRKKTILEKEKKLIKSADFFFVNSHSLAKLHGKTRIPHAVVPQGFRIEDFKNHKKTNNQLPKDKPLLGFIGGLNYRLDFNLLTSLVTRNKQWNFAFWGPIQESHPEYPNTQKQLDALFSQSNVLHGSVKNVQEIPAVIKQFDIATIPYDASQDFNRYSYPMKLFEYFYMGKPVVATPIKELKRFPKLVKIGSTAEIWQHHINTLLSKNWPASFQKQQKKVATENSWNNKINTMLKLIN